MTDAGITHHFGSRDELLLALLHHGGRKLRGAVQVATAPGWMRAHRSPTWST